MTLTPAEVNAMARSRGLWCGYPFLDGAMVGYWRLVFDKPDLDMEDARAIADRYNELQPPAKEGERWSDVERSATNFWRAKL